MNSWLIIAVTHPTYAVVKLKPEKNSGLNGIRTHARLSSKISISIGIISKLRHFVPLNTLYHIYKSLIQPYLLYSIVAWGQADKTHRNRLLLLQKRALRLMSFGEFNAHAVPFFVPSNLLPLDFLYFKLTAALMHDVFNNLTPPHISNIFTYQANIHSYNTRPSSKGNFYVEYSRLNSQSKSFSRYGVRIWNSLRNEMHNLSKHDWIQR